MTGVRDWLVPIVRNPLVIVVLLVAGLVELGTKAVGQRPFLPETTPAGAYARVALAAAERRPKDMFAYLETEAQWASYTLQQMRHEACALVRKSYPPEQRAALLQGWAEEGDAEDGPDAFARLAVRRGWIARLERDLSGVATVEVQGERATVVTARGTRYSLRRRENGIWGLTLFTAELAAEAERASRDLDVVRRAAEDYERARDRVSPSP